MSLWRDSGKTVRFFMFDGRSAFAILLSLVHISKVTLIASASIIVFFAVIEQFGYSLPNARRAAGVLFAGPRRRAMPWWREKYYS